MARAPWIFALVFLAACQAPRTSGPPHVRLGRDVCQRCGMIISEERFAAGYVDPGGRDVGFDDLGEMITEIPKMPPPRPAFFVRTLDGTAWIAAELAFFVRAPGFPTPMGSGVVAFTDFKKAAMFAKSHKTKEPLRFEAMLRAMEIGKSDG